jgi:hypothetical protein
MYATLLTAKNFVGTVASNTQKTKRSFQRHYEVTNDETSHRWTIECEDFRFEVRLSKLLGPCDYVVAEETAGLVAEYLGFHECFRLKDVVCNYLNVSPLTASHFCADHPHWAVESPDDVMSFATQISDEPKCDSGSDSDTDLDDSSKGRFLERLLPYAIAYENVPLVNHIKLYFDCGKRSKWGVVRRWKWYEFHSAIISRSKPKFVRLFVMLERLSPGILPKLCDLIPKQSPDTQTWIVDILLSPQVDLGLYLRALDAYQVEKLVRLATLFPSLKNIVLHGISVVEQTQGKLRYPLKRWLRIREIWRLQTARKKREEVKNKKFTPKTRTEKRKSNHGAPIAKAATLRQKIKNKIGDLYNSDEWDSDVSGDSDNKLCHRQCSSSDSSYDSSDTTSDSSHHYRTRVKPTQIAFPDLEAQNPLSAQ